MVPASLLIAAAAFLFGLWCAELRTPKWLASFALAGAAVALLMVLTTGELSWAFQLLSALGAATYGFLTPAFVTGLRGGSPRA